MRAGNYESEEERAFYLERKGRSKAALMDELYRYYSHYIKHGAGRRWI